MPEKLGKLLPLVSLEKMGYGGLTWYDIQAAQRDADLVILRRDYVPVKILKEVWDMLNEMAPDHNQFLPPTCPDDGEWIVQETGNDAWRGIFGRIYALLPGVGAYAFGAARDQRGADLVVLRRDYVPREKAERLIEIIRVMADGLSSAYAVMDARDKSRIILAEWEETL